MFNLRKPRTQRKSPKLRLQKGIDRKEWNLHIAGRKSAYGRVQLREILGGVKGLVVVIELKPNTDRRRTKRQHRFLRKWINSKLKKEKRWRWKRHSFVGNLGSYHSDLHVGFGRNHVLRNEIEKGNDEAVGKTSRNARRRAGQEGIQYFESTVREIAKRIHGRREKHQNAFQFATNAIQL